MHNRTDTLLTHYGHLPRDLTLHNLFIVTYTEYPSARIQPSFYPFVGVVRDKVGKLSIQDERNARHSRDVFVSVCGDGRPPKSTTVHARFSCRYPTRLTFSTPHYQIHDVFRSGTTELREVLQSVKPDTSWNRYLGHCMEHRGGLLRNTFLIGLSPY
jgi:hypothetical protein